MAPMRAETWYTVDEAVSAGLADRVGTGKAVLPAGLDLAACSAFPAGSRRGYAACPGPRRH